MMYAELRQLLVATGNIFTYTFSAWLPGEKMLHHQFSLSKHTMGEDGTKDNPQWCCSRLMMNRITSMHIR
jgi:hypothetical protein